MKLEAIGSSEDPQFAIKFDFLYPKMANAEFSREQPRWVSLSVRRCSQQLCAMPIERCFRAAQRRAVGLGMRTVAVEKS